MFFLPQIAAINADAIIYHGSGEKIIRSLQMADSPSTQLFCGNLWMQMAGHEPVVMLWFIQVIWCIYMEIAEPARRKIVKNYESNQHAEQTKCFLAQLYGLPDCIRSNLFMIQRKSVFYW